MWILKKLVRYCLEICIALFLNVTCFSTFVWIKMVAFFVADVLLTVEHVKRVLGIEVEKGDSLLLSIDR